MPEDRELLVYEEIKNRLPEPVWENHESAIECYYRAWQIGFSNLKKSTNNNGFIKNYIDTAFNGSLFMWDSSFIVQFGKYGRNVFDFYSTQYN